MYTIPRQGKPLHLEHRNGKRDGFQLANREQNGRMVKDNRNHIVPVVCALIIDSRAQVLVAKRGENQKNPGMWEFPGGKVDQDESEENALKRELEEELGIRVKTGSRLDSVLYDYQEFAIELIPFVCRIAGGEIVPCEHQEVRWITPPQAVSLLWAPADIPVLKQYAELFKKKQLRQLF